MKDKVKYSVRKVHYAMFKENSDTEYDTPVALPGAVALSLEPQGDVSPFYADGILYFNAVANNGYAGDLEAAYFHRSSSRTFTAIRRMQPARC